MTDEQIKHIYAALPVLLWPVFWWSLRQAYAWQAENTNPYDLYEFNVSRWGIVRLRRVARADDPATQHMRAFKGCTADWCFDQLGQFAEMFARANAARLCDVCALACILSNRAPLAQPPLEPG